MRFIETKIVPPLVNGPITLVVATVTATTIQYITISETTNCRVEKKAIYHWCGLESGLCIWRVKVRQMCLPLGSTGSNPNFWWGPTKIRYPGCRRKATLGAGFSTLANQKILG